MSKSINMVFLTGRVGEEPKTMEGQNYKVARFRLATSEGGFKKQDGTEVPEKTYWHSIVAWGNLATLCQYIHKGDLVTVSGQLTYNEWQSQSGEKKISAEIVAGSIVPPPKQRGAAVAVSPAVTVTQAPPAANAAGPVYRNDDLPF